MRSIKVSARVGSTSESGTYRSKGRREDVAQVVSELLPIAVHLPREF
jgi:hypothetical protein